MHGLLHQLTGSAVFDAAASIAIGVLLAWIAYALGRDTEELLIGEAADPELRLHVIGAVVVYLDDRTGQPEWVTITTGLFGSKESFVPLARAEVRPGGPAVPYAKDMVTGAPSAEADGHLSEQDEDELYRYYGLEAGPVQDGPADISGTTGVVGRDTSGPTTDDATGTAGTR